MSETPDVVAAIGKVPFFSSLNDKQRKRMAAMGRVRSYSPGAKIVEEGTTGVGFYLVLDGKAEVRKGARVLATLSKNQFFGEMALIDRQPRSADVVAVEPTACFVLSVLQFDNLVGADPKIVMSMLIEVVKRLRAAQSTTVS
jgi:CRP-like cAMP-binding protein